MISKVEQGTHQAGHGRLEFGSLFDKGVIALERGVPQCLFVRGRLTYFFQRARERGIGVIWIWRTLCEEAKLKLVLLCGKSVQDAESA